MKHTSLLSCLVLSAASMLFSSQASAIAIGTYSMHNHPDGNQAPPLYGLRLDGLLTGNSNEEYTFDFDNALSNMTLTWDGSSIVIDGQAFGGEDDNTTPGGAYVAGTTAVWDIYFEYTGVITSVANGGEVDLQVHADNMNFGSLSSAFGTFSLEDQSDDDTITGLSFQLGDENGAGHRGFDGISGWGWLNHGQDCERNDCTHIYSSDWLFTVTPVPVPAAVWLFGSGLIGLVAVGRRRKA
jgi:hypothetical protein